MSTPISLVATTPADETMRSKVKAFFLRPSFSLDRSHKTGGELQISVSVLSTSSAARIPTT